MENNRRTVTCGELTINDVGRKVVLNAWVYRNRNHGGVHFINLRDRYGITQAVIDEDAPETLRTIASKLKMEYCIAAIGMVRARPASMVNLEMATGAIELLLSDIKILNTCGPLPFMIDGEDAPNETLRLKYRYLDLRTEEMQKHIKMRHEATWAVRSYLTENGFWEIETPTLIKSTPEGARDYLVPSRINPGRFYALPQSPQLYKQILMAGGTDRYYQIARCYRDEDARGDRQPEFTQIDLEMSFASQDDVLNVVEGMMVRTFKDVLKQEISSPFPRLTWREAMELYGTDKPDLRYGLTFHDFAPWVPGSNFEVFKAILETGAVVKAMVVPGAAQAFSRKKISELELIAKSRGAKGLAWMKVGEKGLEGGVSKFFENKAAEISRELGANAGDLILLIGDDWETAVVSLGAVRVKLASDLGLDKPEVFRFCWILDFPMFEKSEEDGNWQPVHHIFSMPQERFIDGMEENPGEVLGQLYDLILNGNELASGSVRIHDPVIQARIFDIVGFPREEAEERFGFLLEAFRYGAPPHAGLAVGFDRLLMVMAQAETIRDVIAFPKNTQGISQLDESPSRVDAQQLADLKLAVIEDEIVI